MSHNTKARQHEQWAIWQGGSGGYSLLKRPAHKKSSLKVSQSVLVLASALMAPHQLPVTVSRHDVILIRHDLHQVQCSSGAPRPVRHHPAGIAVTNITMNVKQGKFCSHTPVQCHSGGAQLGTKGPFTLLFKNMKYLYLLHMSRRPRKTKRHPPHQQAGGGFASVEAMPALTH